MSMSMKWRSITAGIAAILLTLGSGWLQGTMTQRWGFGAAMDDAVATLEQLPLEFGPWQHEQDYELGDSAIELLNCQGYLHRGYRNIETGDLIKLAIMVGPGSKMSIHVPEICFESNNYTLVEQRQEFDVAVNNATHQFWGVTFKMNDVTQRKLRVLYAWSEGDRWLAPRMPRWSVAGAPVLYKLQMSHTLSGAAEVDAKLRDELGRDFLEHVIQSLASRS